MLEMTNGAVQVAAGLCRAVQRAYAGKLRFLAAFAGVFVLTFVVLSNFGLTPDPIKADAALAAGVIDTASTTLAVSTQTPEEPVKIAIASIGLSATVANPTTTAVGTLDADLLKGAVRYPTSALLGAAKGNVVLFGHSSYLPVVGNQAYKTFDGIQKLKAGDLITVYSSDEVYTYSVRTVAKENAASGAGIALDVPGKVLTLSTCNSFATKDDRFVVTADFVESHLIGA